MKFYDKFSPSCDLFSYKSSVPTVPLSIANRALKMHKVLKIEQRSIAIFILRLTKSCTLLYPSLPSSEVTLQRAHIRTKAWSKCFRFNATVLAYNGLRTDLGGAKLPRDLGSMLTDIPSPVASAFYKKIVPWHRLCPGYATARGVGIGGATGAKAP